jgi:hypothetical protein
MRGGAATLRLYRANLFRNSTANVACLGYAALIAILLPAYLTHRLLSRAVTSKPASYCLILGLATEYIKSVRRFTAT